MYLSEREWSSRLLRSVLSMNCLLCDVMCRSSRSECGLQCSGATRNNVPITTIETAPLGRSPPSCARTRSWQSTTAGPSQPPLGFRARLSPLRGCQLCHSKPVHISTPVLDSCTTGPMLMIARSHVLGSRHLVCSASASIHALSAFFVSQVVLLCSWSDPTLHVRGQA